MFGSNTRRGFMQGGMTLSAAALGDFGFLQALPTVAAEEAKVSAKTVQLCPDVEPLVRLLEETPREKIMEAVASRVRSGTGYQQLLTAVFLAGVRNIHARPVGFEFHCVLAVHSAHQAALASPDGDRWLPLFWAIDNFKQSQAVKKSKGAWTMPTLDGASLPSPSQAKLRFIEAMNRWDEAGTDVATAALVRSTGAGELFELFARYGMRDFRHIGHKAIYVANAFRTLNTIGWRHAEPVLRSVAFAMHEHDGANPSTSDQEPDRPWRENLENARKIRTDWQVGMLQPQATIEMLQTLRTAKPADASSKVLELLNRKVDPASIWDGMFLAAGELLMRQPGIIALHSITSCNAMHFIHRTVGNEETRRMAILQAAAFVAFFERAVRQRGKFREDLSIDTLSAGDSKAKGAAAIEAIFANVGKDRPAAASQALAYLDVAGPTGADALLIAGRRLVASKGKDSHDYKLSSAVMEDFANVTPSNRNRFLASSLYWLHGSGDPDNDLIRRTRAALA